MGDDVSVHSEETGGSGIRCLCYHVLEGDWPGWMIWRCCHYYEMFFLRLDEESSAGDSVLMHLFLFG